MDIGFWNSSRKAIVGNSIALSATMHCSRTCDNAIIQTPAAIPLNAPLLELLPPTQSDPSQRAQLSMGATMLAQSPYECNGPLLPHALRFNHCEY